LIEFGANDTPERPRKCLLNGIPRAVGKFVGNRAIPTQQEHCINEMPDIHTGCYFPRHFSSPPPDENCVCVMGGRGKDAKTKQKL